MTSSSAPCVRTRSAPTVAAEPSAPSFIRPSTGPSRTPHVAPPDNYPGIIPVPKRPSSCRPRPIRTLGASPSIRPSRASFVPPVHNDPGAPGEELSSNPRERIRLLCFTENNPTMTLEDFCNALRQWAFVSYFCIGAEWSSSGTYHFQGYLELTRQVSFSSVKAVLPRAEILHRRGNSEKAAVYCQKDGNSIEYGTRSAPGARSDLHFIAGSIKAGEPMSAIASSNPEMFSRYHRGMWALRNITVPDRADAPEVRVFVLAPLEVENLKEPGSG